MSLLTRSFDPLEHYRALYQNTPRPLAFQPGDLDNFEKWHLDLVEALTEKLGGFPSEKVPLRPEVIEEEETLEWRRLKVVYDSDDGVSVPAHLLLPRSQEAGGSDDGTRPRPAVIALHGHGYGANDLVGLDPEGRPRQGDPGYHKDFALSLVQRGFVVLVPEQAGFGERRDPKAKEEGPFQWSCRQAAFYAQLLGKTLVGLRVWDVMRGIDYLESLPQVDPERIGCMGISGGGTTALFASVLEPRIKVSVISGYLNTFKESILAIRHCECNYVPGILTVAEMDDLACAIAPRPLLIESGIHDRIFPIDAVRRAFDKVKGAYRSLDKEERIDSDLFDGGHEISGVKAFPWLERWLASDVTTL